MGGALKRLRVMAFGLALSVAAACAPIYQNHGYAPTDDELAKITVGRDTRDSVATAVGRPSAESLLGDDAWYYVQSRWKTMGMRAPEEVSREVVAISFNKSGTVSNVERFGLEQGRVVTLSRRVTDSNIKGVNFLRQLLGNIGNFRADQFLK